MSETLTAVNTDNQVTVNEPEVSGAPKQEVGREDLKANGWSAKEIELAEKRGIIKKKEAVENKAEVKADAETKPEVQAGENKQEVKPEKKSSLPEFSFKTPEQEKAWLDAFGPGTEQRAMYFRMKNERQQRQAAEKERDRLMSEFQSLKAEIETIKSGRGVQQEVDEQGNVIDPEEKPLTLKQWKELQRQEAEERERQQQELREQGGSVAEALKTQEEYAKSIYPDYAETLKLAEEVMQNLDSMIPNKWEQQKAISMIKDLQIKAADAHKYGIDDFNAALVSYEIGKFHPNYGKPKPNGHRSEPQSNGNLDPNKANGSLTPEQMKRAEQNTQRRVSSASIPGGGVSRTISAEDVTLNDVLKMSPTQREAFRNKNPERWSEIRRG